MTKRGVGGILLGVSILIGGIAIYSLNMKSLAAPGVPAARVPGDVESSGGFGGAGQPILLDQELDTLVTGGIGGELGVGEAKSRVTLEELHEAGAKYIRAFATAVQEEKFDVAWDELIAHRTILGQCWARDFGPEWWAEVAKQSSENAARFRWLILSGHGEEGEVRRIWMRECASIYTGGLSFVAGKQLNSLIDAEQMFAGVAPFEAVGTDRFQLFWRSGGMKRLDCGESLAKNPLGYDAKLTGEYARKRSADVYSWMRDGGDAPEGLGSEVLEFDEHGARKGPGFSDWAEGTPNAIGILLVELLVFSAESRWEIGKRWGEFERSFDSLAVQSWLHTRWRDRLPRQFSDLENFELHGFPLVSGATRLEFTDQAIRIGPVDGQVYLGRVWDPE